MSQERLTGRGQKGLQALSIKVFLHLTLLQISSVATGREVPVGSPQHLFSEQQKLPSEMITDSDFYFQLYYFQRLPTEIWQ